MRPPGKAKVGLLRFGGARQLGRFALFTSGLSEPRKAWDELERVASVLAVEHVLSHPLPPISIIELTYPHPQLGPTVCQSFRLVRSATPANLPLLPTLCLTEWATLLHHKTCSIQLPSVRTAPT